MADALNTNVVVCGGGLVSNVDPITQASQMSGSAAKLVNYEPALRGGYRRISGFDNSYGTLPGYGKVLGLHVHGPINDGIIGARRPVDDGDPYLYYWDNTAEDWQEITTPVGHIMAGVVKVRFSEYNWGEPALVITDGVNPAGTYNGTTYTAITADLAPDSPALGEVFASHLFLAGDASEEYNLYFSAPLNATDFTPASGAGVINVGFEIVAIKSFRKELYIFGVNQIKKLTGTSQADFLLEDVTTNIGCIARDTVFEFGGDLLFLGPDGMRPVSGTSRIGDVELETVSRHIQDVFDTYIAGQDLDLMSSVVIRSKSQFRLFFADSESLSILGALRRKDTTATMFEYSQLIGIEATCAASGYVGQNEIAVHGDSSGNVHRQEVGSSFNGEPIFSVYQTPFLYMQDPEVRKIFYKINTYLLSEGPTEISIGVTYDYGSLNTYGPNSYLVSTADSAAFYGTSTYAENDSITVGDKYDGDPNPSRVTNISGSANSMAVTYVTDSLSSSHTIQAITTVYGTADRR